ncbi:MAG: diaminopimelate epimerase [Zymomonas mobilis subsp. pomaceae]|uniref:Diaminopimelate epimerase n=1 Tax=Zymomonas mobilis subsp. pomaceae (strain ATCC 29192 / DSM 22645 / JCM 10191 / CCUG 17912 / NBRC 13757 / NCIMB 11200 / NRRL B-4491 / Barker I) TaxID=579138 RepID=F8EU37_ZYMMT|nr:diaminopimelate epimerase [Zymomonas mobilis]AEI37117.1 diaminopimelate epimerase [Zymomonas mobilis subsp. pomaceae ATCC 29192]MDX5948488.1 diaminopimelate epimerase [Zymomonas mobilis subsp. pomaceae]GEB89447.1 diaminopimelate epimerase [Zymomonas mobilis subsp. pomaceae]
MTFSFHKMHGLGNDFIILDARKTPIQMNAARAQALSNRHTGIGCDQLIIIGTGDEQADVSMQIWNADGSEVEACGNATRCVPVFIGHDVIIRTAAGLLDARLADEGACVDMGQPRFSWQEIPLEYAMDTLALPVAWGNLKQPTAVNIGNPHLVFVVEDVDAIDFGQLGPIIEYDPLFPERINVNIVMVVGKNHLKMRTWERGAGLTRACGTGACATFAVTKKRGLVSGKTLIDLPGGQLLLNDNEKGHIIMQGPAQYVFKGEADWANFS